VSRRETEPGRDGPTADPRRRDAQAAHEERALQQLRSDALKLLTLPEFRRYMTHVIYGRLGLTKSAYRANAGETQRAAALQGAAAELLRELGDLDSKGFRLLEMEHVNQEVAELELSASVNQEQSDA
jgi:hypothetical protein